MKITLSQTKVFALSLKLNQTEIKRAFAVADLGYGYKAAMLPPSSPCKKYVTCDFFLIWLGRGQHVQYLKYVFFLQH